jgi:hypothetical protein
MDPIASPNVNVPAPAAAPAASVAPAAPAAPGRAAGTGSLSDNRDLRASGSSKLGLDAAEQPGTVSNIATALGELGVVGALAEVAKAYTQTTFDPAAIGSSLGKLADNLQQITSKVKCMPGVGDALTELGGLGSIISGVKSLREGVAAAKSAEDTPEKVQASVGAAAGAAKIVGGLATALSPFCAPLGAVGAALTAAGVAFDAGKVAMENRVPLKQALMGIQLRMTGMIPPAVRQKVNDAARIVANNSSAIVANNSSAMVRTPG